MNDGGELVRAARGFSEVRRQNQGRASQREETPPERGQVMERMITDHLERWQEN
jgi:hypothetical protein